MFNIISYRQISRFFDILEQHMCCLALGDKNSSRPLCEWFSTELLSLLGQIIRETTDLFKYNNKLFQSVLHSFVKFKNICALDSYLNYSIKIVKRMTETNCSS